jgi:pilus assembly protein CpaF
VVLQLERMSDGRRRVVSVQEITGMEGDVVTMQEIFRFRRSGVDGEGRVLGRFEATGIRPRFAERLLMRGIELGNDLFSANRGLE